MKPRAGIPEIRTGQGAEPLTEEEFRRRARHRFVGKPYEQAAAAVNEVIGAAYENYKESNKAPYTRPAGPGFADPTYELSVEWSATREAVLKAEEEYRRPDSPRRVLLICAAARNDKTCPGEMSKTFRLVKIAEETLRHEQVNVDLLDLSALTSEYGRVIYPCKACVSTAMPLCHWPCSCYPNHALGQTNDWMNEIYPRWVAAHGIMIVTPVYWYQAPAGLKAMMDRLVCADGGNPDPTSTKGKDPKLAKELELNGWGYPRHLAGRAFSIVVHGDAAGADTLRQSLRDWLVDMKLVPAEGEGVISRYVGYYEPYATSHEALDVDLAVQEELRNAARGLAAKALELQQSPKLAWQVWKEPRPK